MMAPVPEKPPRTTGSSSDFFTLPLTLHATSLRYSPGADDAVLGKAVNRF